VTARLEEGSDRNRVDPDLGERYAAVVRVVKWIAIVLVDLSERSGVSGAELRRNGVTFLLDAQALAFPP